MCGLMSHPNQCSRQLPQLLIQRPDLGVALQSEEASEHPDYVPV